MNKWYCTCKSKTHKGFSECEIDEEQCCIDCGYYATRSVVRVTTESRYDYDNPAYVTGTNRILFDCTVMGYIRTQEEQ